MPQQPKPAQAPAREATAQPQTQEHVKPGLPGAESSKVSTTKQRDGRAPHDKDGNAERSATSPKPR